MSWQSLNRRIVACERCPRLRAYCETIAATKRRAYNDCTYWGKPVPNFGDPQARLLIVGLAPAAHGANRTGRMFTGDRSGDFLFRALHRAGFASSPTATHVGDNLSLSDCAITAVAHCAPPDNKPTQEELNECSSWLSATMDATRCRVIVALGGIAWKESIRELRQREWIAERPPRFGHGATARLTDGRLLIGSYHPSQQNTFTGRLTEAMFDDIFATVRRRLR